MAKSKPTAKQKQKVLELTKMEYFRLETHEYEIKLECKEIEISDKNILISNAQLEILRLKMQLANVNVGAENRNKDYRKARAETHKAEIRSIRGSVGKRLGLKDSAKNWDYCKQTGKIILPKGG